jgi:hypothetical protein
MKKIILGLLMSVCLYSNAQEHLMYKCLNITQRDSISDDLRSKGFVKYGEESDGTIINAQLDKTFCFNKSLNGFREVSLSEMYSKIKSKVNTINSVTNIEEIKDLCSDIVITNDKFTGEISYNSPDIENISFIKNKKRGVISQYVSISIYSTYLSGYNNYGVTILFKNGKKIIRKNEKIDVDASTGSDWRYSAFFTPNSNEINLLKSFEIEAVKLYIFDSNISGGDSIKRLANCVLITPKIVSKKKK